MQISRKLRKFVVVTAIKTTPYYRGNISTTATTAGSRLKTCSIIVVNRILIIIYL